MINFFEQFFVIFETADIVPNFCVLLTIYGILKNSWFILFLFFHERRIDIIKENIFFELEYLNIILMLKKLLKYFDLRNIYYREIYTSQLFITENEFSIIFNKDFIMLFYYFFYFLTISTFLYIIINKFLFRLNKIYNKIYNFLFFTMINL